MHILFNWKSNLANKIEENDFHNSKHLHFHFAILLIFSNKKHQFRGAWRGFVRFVECDFGYDENFWGIILEDYRTRAKYEAKLVEPL